MPPKKRRGKSKARPTQSQRQSQRVTVNIGSTRAKRKQTGRGKLPPPSHMHNLAPTFVTAQQVDYVGLIGEISRLTKQVQDPVPIRNPVTPLQSVLQASTAEKMAGEAAIRRAGPTAENFQEQPSVSNFDFVSSPVTPASTKFFKRPEGRRQYSERGMMGAEDERGFVSSAQERGRQAAASRRFTQELQRQGMSEAPVLNLSQPVKGNLDPLGSSRSSISTLEQGSLFSSVTSAGSTPQKKKKLRVVDA